MPQDNNEPDMELLLRETLRRIRKRLTLHRVRVVLGFVLVGGVVGYVADYFLGTRFLTITALIIVILGCVKALKEAPTIQETIAEAFEQLKEKRLMANQIREKIISRKDATLVFGLKKDEWEKECEKFFATGWAVSEHDTGNHVATYDPSTGVGFSIMPFYENEHTLPNMVVIGSHLPVGVLPPMTAQAQKEMEPQAQQDLGGTYCVNLIYRRTESLESIELMLTKLDPATFIARPPPKSGALSGAGSRL
jgi:hypothetical protein